VSVELNGVDVTTAFAPATGDHALIGLVEGFVLGENTIKARVTGPVTPRPADELIVTNHPITGPIFSGPHQLHFVCTPRSGLASRSRQ
jgi:hypothetical protein